LPINKTPHVRVKIHLDYCSRTFGTAPCTAVLSASVPCKCFNSWATCEDRPNYLKTDFVLTFCKPSSNLPRDEGTIFPLIEDVSEYSATVNIGGGDARMSALGERGTIVVRMKDAPYHDRYWDKYAKERVTGVAQVDEPGYLPESRGTILQKLDARFPYLYNRTLEVEHGYLTGGQVDQITGLWVARDFVSETVRNYVITETSGLQEDGSFEIKGSDIIDLVSNEKALIPAPSEGYLITDIGVGLISFSITPAGIGNLKYPASGNASIGSELVSYTRVNDVITLTGRGLRGTKEATHAADDTFQVALSIRDMRVDDYLETLCISANLPAAYRPKLTKWKPEVDRWAPDVKLNTDVMKPTKAAELIGELAVLGVSIYPKLDGSEMLIKMTRPPDNDTIYDIDDDSGIISIKKEKREEDRFSLLVFFFNQSDPSQNLSSKGNYDIVRARVDEDAQSANEYGKSITRETFCRLFNRGGGSIVPVLSKRLLNRYRDPPTLYTIELDWKDSDIGLTDIIRVTSGLLRDKTGKIVPTLLQVVRRIDAKPGSRFTIVAQSYRYNARYGFITENTRPSYTSSSVAQKATGAYFLNDSLSKFTDGGESYRFI
jgi:hypothetical protein